MTTLIRTDASLRIGTGHVMRCLVLAKQKSKINKENCEGNILFLCRKRPGNMIDFIRSQGFPVIELSSVKEDDFSIGGNMEEEIETIASLSKDSFLKNQTLPNLVIDHHGIGIEYEKKVRPFVKQILVIDDLEDRPHDCDILLNQNYSTNTNRYEGLLPKHCQKLLGPKYALLREEFYQTRKILQESYYTKEFDKKKVLLFFGGTDPENYTERALRILMKCGDFEPQVVVGKNHPAIQGLEKILSKIPNSSLFVQTPFMHKILSSVSWFLGSGGSITWERMYLGVSGIVLSIAENQKKIVSELAKDGFHIETNLETLEGYILKMDWTALERMNWKCWEYTKSHGKYV